MKSQTATILVTLFTALLIQCASDGSALQASPVSSSHSQGNSPMCGGLNAAGVEMPLSGQPALRAAAGKAMAALAEGSPFWSLAQSIDHPPERSV